MSDPNLVALTALRRLRHIETDTARRDLGDALAHETALVSRDTALLRELNDARQFSGEFDREAFGAWLVRKREERARLADAVNDAAARTAAARNLLAQRRVAETAADEVFADAMTARAAVADRREQLMLEDVARALKRAADQNP